MEGWEESRLALDYNKTDSHHHHLYISIQIMWIHEKNSMHAQHFDGWLPMKKRKKNISVILLVTCLQLPFVSCPTDV